MNNLKKYSDSKLVAKNTVFLYLRMLVITVVGLFTTRYLLKALGVEDLGIYNVIGGIVGFMSFLNAAMTSSSTRFISLSLTKDDLVEQKKVFSTTFMLHLYLALIIFVLLETIGLWIVNNVLVIPEGRLDAANIVYQFSIFSCLLNILLVPFSAALISHEKMGIYAYISIFDIFLKLLLTISVCYYEGDRLILYGGLLFVSFVLHIIITVIYCIRKIGECGHIVFKVDKQCTKEISKYFGWSMYTNTAHIFSIHGINIMLNLFFGPNVNASRQIAGNVQSKIMSFVDSFQMAINPQIIKSYAVGAFNDVFKLLYQSERITFYLLSIFIIPICLTTKDILYIWLGQVPMYSDIFCQLILAMSFINALSNPFMKIIQADGRLKKNSLSVGTAIFLIIPLSYVALKLGCDAQVVYIINLVIYIVTYLIRIKNVYDICPFDVMDYFKICIIKPLIVVSIPSVVAITVVFFIEHTLINIIVFDLSLVLAIIFSVYIFGLEAKEKDIVNNKILGIIKINKNEQK